jgi:hypothetical protein
MEKILKPLAHLNRSFKETRIRVRRWHFGPTSGIKTRAKKRIKLCNKRGRTLPSFAWPWFIWVQNLRNGEPSAGAGGGARGVIAGRGRHLGANQALISGDDCDRRFLSLVGNPSGFAVAGPDKRVANFRGGWENGVKQANVCRGSLTRSGPAGRRQGSMINAMRPVGGIGN